MPQDDPILSNDSSKKSENHKKPSRKPRQVSLTASIALTIAGLFAGLWVGQIPIRPTIIEEPAPYVLVVPESEATKANETTFERILNRIGEKRDSVEGVIKEISSAFERVKSPLTPEVRQKIRDIAQQAASVATKAACKMAAKELAKMLWVWASSTPTSSPTPLPASS